MPVVELRMLRWNVYMALLYHSSLCVRACFVDSAALSGFQSVTHLVACLVRSSCGTTVIETTCNSATAHTALVFRYLSFGAVTKAGQDSCHDRGRRSDTSHIWMS